MTESVAVLGAGSWGTALAIQLARNELQVNLWGHLPEHIERLIEQRENREYLPGFPLASNIKPQVSLQVAITGCKFLLIAIPSKGFRSLLQTLKPMLTDDTALFWASKGFEIETGLLLHEVVGQELPNHRYGIVSGPTFASEVARDGLGIEALDAVVDREDRAELLGALRLDRPGAFTLRAPAGEGRLLLRAARHLGAEGAGDDRAIGELEIDVGDADLDGLILGISPQ